MDREQFEEFVDRCGLVAESTETLGSLGAPGCGYGWAPAISFRGDDPDAIQNAYVTPFPRTKKEPLDRNDWQRLRGAVLAVYGQVLHFDFVTYDDPDYVTANAHVQAGLTWAGVAWAFRASFAGNWFPLTWLSHMLDCTL